MKKLKIKKGDLVQVLTGSKDDKSEKKRIVLEVNPKTMKVKVQGVRVQTHFDKKEGLLKKEAFVDYSNVRLIEKASEKSKKTSKKATKSK